MYNTVWTSIIKQYTTLQHLLSNHLACTGDVAILFFTALETDGVAERTNETEVNGDCSTHYEKKY